MNNILIVTTNNVDGYVATQVFGECFGLVVKSRNMFSNFGASVKSLVGGELTGITTLLQDCRNEAINRLIAEAKAKGANAVLSMRFETTEYNHTGIEVCAYGTAVYLEKI